jgi:uncharacterized membrane protein (DUF2068 family)
MRRPRGVTIAAALVGALGGLSILFGALAVAAVALGPADPSMDAEAAREVAAIGIIYVVFGTAQLLVAWALWNLRRWAWWLTIVLQGVNVVQALGAMAFTEVTNVDVAVFTSLAFSLAIIGYFLTKGVRTAFGR